jgi:glycosyltransferase involved in cell wall biosynthesis
MVALPSKGVKSRSLRVSMVSTYPPDRCGVAYYSMGLVSGIRCMVSLNVIANKIAGSTSKDKTVVRCWRKGSIFYPLSVLSQCIRSRGQIVHIHHHYVLYGGPLTTIEFPLILLGLRMMRKPSVVTFHSVIPRNKLNGRLFKKYGLSSKLTLTKRALMTSILKSIVRLSNGAIVHDETMKACLVEDYGADNRRVYVVPHGVTEMDSLDAEKAKSMLGFPNTDILLYQGFLTDGKGVEILVRAFKLIHDVRPHTHLLIAGGFRDEASTYAKSVKTLISEEGLEENVTITGFLPENSIPTYFSAASVIVLPYTEADVLGTSEVLAEVASLGKPVIATKTPKFIGLLKDGHNALMVESGSVQQLSEAVLKVLSNVELSNQLGYSLKQDASCRSWSKVGAATVDVYEKVLGSR